MKEQSIFAGRYKLIKQLGRGGFSEVWLAEDEMTEGTQLAIKMYAGEAGLDELGIKQFRREYAKIQPLNHSGLLKANHFDICDGRPYLVMPYLKNQSLAHWMFENGQPDETFIARLIGEVASALKYLHSKGIIHQDIKPENIMIDDDGHFLLADFGISSSLRSTLRKSTTTEQLKHAKTHAYSAPERFGKRPQTIPESDIFSLGVSLYELCTGELPFHGEGGLVLNSNDQIPLIPESYSNQLAELIECCMFVDSAQRPSLEKLEEIANEFIYKGKWVDGTTNKNQNIVINQRESQTTEFQLSKNKQTNIINEDNDSIAETVNNNKKNNNKTFYIILTIAAIIFGVVFLRGCFKKNNSTPEVVAEKFLHHFNNREYAEAKKLGTQATFDMISFWESFPSDEPIEYLYITDMNCTEDGDKARCTYLENGNYATIELIKEEDVWKVHMPKEMTDEEFSIDNDWDWD